MVAEAAMATHARPGGPSLGQPDDHSDEDIDVSPPATKDATPPPPGYQPAVTAGYQSSGRHARGAATPPAEKPTSHVGRHRKDPASTPAPTAPPPAPAPAPSVPVSDPPVPRGDQPGGPRDHEDPGCPRDHEHGHEHGHGRGHLHVRAGGHGHAHGREHERGLGYGREGGGVHGRMHLSPPAETPDVDTVVAVVDGALQPVESVLG
jgi:hypothetical protein